MFVELIELLRCPRPHEEAQLVASASRTEARHIVEGLLGCPVCGAEFRIVNGVVVFDEPAKGTRSERANAETAMRLRRFAARLDCCLVIRKRRIEIAVFCAQAIDFAARIGELCLRRRIGNHARQQRRLSSCCPRFTSSLSHS